MRRFFILTLAALMAVAAAAQESGKRERFSPQKFQAELEQFIVKEACLTPAESAKFFPKYREMQKKQRGIFDEMRRLAKLKPTDEAECRKVIIQRDNYDVELKRIQQSYHSRFLDILPASKLFEVIKAEDKFHRRALKRYNRDQRQPKASKAEKAKEK